MRRQIGGVEWGEKGGEWGIGELDVLGDSQTIDYNSSLAVLEGQEFGCVRLFLEN